MTTSGEAFRHLVTGCLDGVVVVDVHDVVLFANPAAMRMMRVEGAALVGTSFGHPITGADLAEVEFMETGMAAEIRVSPLMWEGAPARVVTLRDVTARRRGRHSQSTAESLLDLAERVADLGTWDLNLLSGRLIHSAGTERISGRALSADEWVSNPRRVGDVVVHPDDRDRWNEAVDTMEAGGAIDIEHRIVRPSGETRVIRVVAEPVRGADGTPVRFRATLQDITERRRAEAALRETYRLLEAVADNTPTVIFVKDQEGRYVFSNAAHAQWAGRSRDELATLTVHDVMPREAADLEQARHHEVLTKGVTRTDEVSLERPGRGVGTWLITMFPILDDEGRPHAVGGVGVDVTEQKRAMESLRTSEERFRLLAQYSQDVTFLVRRLPEPWVEYVSPAAGKVLGIMHQRLIGELDTVVDEFHPDDRDTVRALLATNDPKLTVEEFHRPDGSAYWLEIRLAPIHDEAGQVMALEGNLRDVTERVKSEHERERLTRQLAQSERLDALGRLAGGVAHDVNNLLAVILGTAELIQEDLLPEDQRFADVERIAHTAQRGAALTRQLLIFSRREPSRPEILDLNEVVTGVEDMLRRTIGEDVVLHSCLSPGLKAVNVDRAKLEQVVLNLVVNARAAMPEGGRLTLRTDAVTSDRALPSPAGGLPSVPPGDYSCLTVADTGHGMTPEVARRAFEPFFTTREMGKGSGLGLATVHGVVTEAGGHIGLDSRPGEGTTVRVYLPACSERAGQAVAADAVSPQGKGETVLVVEDEDPVREVVARILSSHNYRPLTARGPEEALEIWGKCGNSVDLLLTDVVMPGMVGPRLAERLRDTRPGLPVLFMSGYVAGEQAAVAEVAHDSAMLTKPFEVASILRRVRETLDRR